MFGEDCVGRKLSELVQGINFDANIPRILSDSSCTTKHELRHKDKFLEITISPLVDFQTNELFGTIAVTEDITEKKKLEAQLIHSTKMSAVGQLAAGIAHEFNNILTGIMGYTGFAMSRVSIEQIRNDLKIVEKASNRAVEIVNKLLTFSRQKEEKFQLISIDEVIEDTLVLIEHTFQSDGIKILRHYGKISPIRMNVGEIQQVILNLAINSSHAMPEGGVIGISTELKDDCVKIDFSDTGIGISKENMSRIFEPFFTTKRKIGSKSGTGLGLSVVYAIIERHGGRIDLSSEVGKGTTFTIFLPNVQRLSNAPKADSQHNEDSDKVLQTKRKGSILVVDDEEFVCDIIKESLSSVGHNIVVASSGEAAIELLEKDHFDIVFLNLGLPGKSGFDVLKEMKVVAPGSLFVIISGRAEEELTDGIAPECAFSFITKPFTVNQIQNTVARILGAV
jgi:two-component system cell cycle sensor histidine kinase/response regulator CckA